MRRDPGGELDLVSGSRCKAMRRGVMNESAKQIAVVMAGIIGLAAIFGALGPQLQPQDSPALRAMEQRMEQRILSQLPTHAEAEEALRRSSERTRAAQERIKIARERLDAANERLRIAREQHPAAMERCRLNPTCLDIMRE
jgi:hypothetical protein